MKLYPHQKQVLEAVKDKDHCAFYLDMGLGKTFVGAEKLIDLGRKGGHTEYINVACNSVGVIFCKIVNQVYRGSSVGLIASPEGRKIAEKWIRERELNEEQESDEQTGQSSLATR